MIDVLEMSFTLSINKYDSCHQYLSKLIFYQASFMPFIIYFRGPLEKMFNHRKKNTPKINLFLV